MQVLRNDGGGKYTNIYLFCERNGIARQRTEANNLASNGKAERMHRTILNMARCMIFHCRQPMHCKNSLKKRSQRGIILGVSEEVKGFRVYLMDDKKVVNTQHVKYIETLSRIQKTLAC